MCEGYLDNLSRYNMCVKNSKLSNLDNKLIIYSHFINSPRNK